ncbi:MAG: hypothetical protein QXT43_00635 [Candidatus Micrarchaeaceae archaeon]
MLVLLSVFLLSLYSTITSPTYVWFPVAIAGALAVISILSLIYALSPLLGRADLRVWAKIKIYEVMFSIVLVFIFFAFMALFTSINFGSLLGKLSPSSCTTNYDIYSLAMCDLNKFNGYVSFLNDIGYLLMLPSLYATGITISLYFVSITTSLFGLTSSFGISFTAISLLFIFYMLSDVLLLLLSVSVLLFAVFMALGLILRMFAITRTFGGALIAFGIGIGVLFPLLVSIGYGFIGATISSRLYTAALSFLESAIGPGILLGLILYPITGVLPGITGLYLVLEFVGYVIAGLLFMPIFILTILDVFIRDFSQAVGERMNFLSILSNLI